MNRLAFRALALAALAAAAACGEAPTSDFPQAGEPGPGPNLQRLSFTGVAEPASGRLQLIMEPQAIGRIPESADGNVLTVAANTVQVYGGSVAFVSNNALYPAGCSRAAPQLMLAGVEVFSGFTEQLRNVYANLTATSSGPTACATNSLGAFAGAVGTSRGAWLYQPLDGGAAPSAIKRSVQWALSLPDNSPYWFTGDVWAEVIPQPPTSLTPADGATYGRFLGFFQFSLVTLRWTDDPLADGTNPEGFAVARPTGGASLAILQCGPSSIPFDPATCTTVNLAPTVVTTGSRAGAFASGSWYQWSVRSSFLLPGAGTRTLGSAVLTRHFGTVP